VVALMHGQLTSETYRAITSLLYYEKPAVISVFDTRGRVLQGTKPVKYLL